MPRFVEGLYYQYEREVYAEFDTAQEAGLSRLTQAVVLNKTCLQIWG
jgi:hypothetical protein